MRKMTVGCGNTIKVNKEYAFGLSNGKYFYEK